MKKLTGYCGYNCQICPARSDDPAERQRLVDGWRKYLGHQGYTAENVRCDGCPNEGRLADKQCRARPCAIERGMDSCARCGDFPCPKVRPLMGSRHGLLAQCYPATGTLTRAEYDRCLAQFDSMPALLHQLVEAGKMPAWVLEADPGQGAWSDE